MTIKAIIGNKIPLVVLFLMLGFLTSSCDKELDIQTNFPFELEIMPVPVDLEFEQTAEIICHIKKEGQYNGTTYSMRFFKYDGEGSLIYKEKPMKPNVMYLLAEENFKLHYKAKSNGSHKFQLWVSDNFGNEKTVEFSF